MRTALVQLNSTGDVARNLERAVALIREAAGQGAEFVQTPEVTNIIPTNGAALFGAIQSEAEDETLAVFRELAKELSIVLHIGSLALRSEDDPERAANRAFLIRPNGEVAARYDKIHMFEADLGDKGRYREAARYRPGDEAISVEIERAQIGITICYDIRFPHLYRSLAQAGATVLTAPSAFTVPTGEAHWHTLLRARAIENGCFMLAAAQCGPHGGTDEGTLRESYGHSLIVDPWGTVLADGGEGEGIVVADLDLSLPGKARKRIPSLSQARDVPVRHYPAS